MGTFSKTFKGAFHTGALLNYTAEYKTVLNAMPTKPITTDAFRQNRWLKKMIDKGYYGKAVLLDMLTTHSADASLINWKTPGTFNPSAVNSPVFEKYAGWTGNNGTIKYLRSNFIPSVNAGGKIATNNLTAMVGIGSNVLSTDFDFGAYDGTQSFRMFSRYSEFMCAHANSANTGQQYANTNSIGHYAISRNDTVNATFNRNKIANTFASDNSTKSLVTKELYIGGSNANGVAYPCNRQIRYFFLFSYLTQAEINDVIDITEEYLDSYHKGLLDNQSFDNGKMVFTYDDGFNLSSTVTPIFNAKGVRYTQYLNGSLIGTPTYLTWLQAKQLSDAGFDMQDHGWSHAHMAALTRDQLLADLNTNADAFVANGLPSPEHVCYPWGEFNASTKLWASEIRKTGRTISSPKTATKDAIDLMEINVINAASVTTAAIKTLIDDMKLNKKAGVVYSHTAIGNEAELIDYAQSVGVDIVTMKQLYNEVMKP